MPQDPPLPSTMSKRVGLWQDIGEIVQAVDSGALPYDRLDETDQLRYHLGKREIKFDELMKSPQAMKDLGLISPRTAGMIESPSATQAKGYLQEFIRQMGVGASQQVAEPWLEPGELAPPPAEQTLGEKIGLTLG